jgi:hypothetical protein
MQTFRVHCVLAEVHADSLDEARKLVFDQISANTKDWIKVSSTVPSWLTGEPDSDTGA